MTDATNKTKALDVPLAELQTQRLLRVHDQLHAALAALPAQHSVKGLLTAAIAELQSYGRSLERDRR